MEVLSVRVPRELLRWLDELARLEGRGRSEVVREILERGVRERRVELALRLYREGRATLWRAAELAGLSLWEMVEELRRRGVEVQYGPGELEEDLGAVGGGGTGGEDPEGVVRWIRERRARVGGEEARLGDLEGVDLEEEFS